MKLDVSAAVEALRARVDTQHARADQYDLAASMCDGAERAAWEQSGREASDKTEQLDRAIALLESADALLRVARAAAQGREMEKRTRDAEWITIPLAAHAEAHRLRTVIDEALAALPDAVRAMLGER